MVRNKVNKEEIFNHFKETLGVIPEPLRLLGEEAPDALQGYYLMRNWFQREPPEGAMPKKYKEILFVALDIILGAPVEFAEAHVKAAIKAGAKSQEISEAVVLTLMLAGMPKYMSTGYKMIKAALEAEK